MKTKYLLLLMFLLSCFAAKTFSQLVFINQYTGPGGSTNVSNAIATDASNNSYVTGFTTGILSGHDITTVKYDPTGRLIWARSYNGTGNSTDEAYAITLDNLGNIYVTGSTTGTNTDKDMIIIKYNSAGTQQWLSTYSSTGSFPDEAYAITLDVSGDPVISGYSNVAGLGNQMTLIKYDANSGVQTWIQTSSGI